jgi:hypothetical protein
MPVYFARSKCPKKSDAVEALRFVESVHKGTTAMCFGQFDDVIFATSLRQVDLMRLVRESGGRRLADTLAKPNEYTGVWAASAGHHSGRIAKAGVLNTTFKGRSECGKHDIKKAMKVINKYAPGSTTFVIDSKEPFATTVIFTTSLPFYVLRALINRADDCHVLAESLCCESEYDIRDDRESLGSLRYERDFPREEPAAKLARRAGHSSDSASESSSESSSDSSEVY